MHVSGVLFSPRHGWFYWHPPLLIGILAFLAWSLRRPIALPWVFSLAATVAVNAAWPTWWFGSSFGNRAFEVSTFFAMVGFAFLMGWTRGRPAWRRALVCAAAAAVACNLLLLALALSRRIPSDGAVTYADAGRALAGWVSGTRGPER
jgi:hypothetical protein